MLAEEYLPAEVPQIPHTFQPKVRSRVHVRCQAGPAAAAAQAAPAWGWPWLQR